MSNQVVKVKREVLKPCITCLLCHRLLRDATTISECLHTFCRKCIYKKLSDEETECCPVCNIDLGCVPLEKLRPDHCLQDVRAKIFPYKRLKVKAPEIVTPSNSMLPTKRKERSLSSLVVSTPRVSTQGGLTGRRSKSARKASRGSFTIEKPLKKDDDSSEEHHPESSNSPETNKSSQNLQQSSAADPSDQSSPGKGGEIGSKPWEAKTDLWKPLTCLVEVANRSKSSGTKSEGLHTHDDEGIGRKTKSKDNGLKSKVQDEKNSNDHTQQESEKPKKLRKVRQKKARNFGDFKISPQVLLDAATAKAERRNHPVWFSLVASNDHDGDSTLPQIPSNYLRIKDGNIPVSFIQKYLKGKLDLTSEDEVEIRCMGQTVVPTLTLNNVVDLWYQTTNSERVPVIIGQSAKDFVMTLGYARRVPAA